MPVDLNRLMSQVNTMSADERLHVSARGDIERGTGLRGLRSILIWARSDESRGTVRAFKNAITVHPVYQAFAAEVSAPLDALIDKAKPLTAERVRETMRVLDMAAAVQRGRELAGDALMPEDQRKLPLGHGADFGQYCIRRGLGVSSEQECARALCGYLSEVLLARDKTALTRLPAGTSREAAALMELVYGPSEDFVRNEAARQLGGGLRQFTLQGLEGAWARVCAQDLSLVSSLDAGHIQTIIDSGRADEMLAALREAQSVVKPEQCNMLCEELYNSASLASPEDRAQAVTRFLINIQAGAVAGGVLARFGLPRRSDTIRRLSLGRRNLSRRSLTTEKCPLRKRLRERLKSV